LWRRAPEGGLVHPIGFTKELCAEAECLEHFNRSTSNAIRLSQLKRALATLDEARSDIRECRKLRCKYRSRRTVADDQDVDLGRKIRRSFFGTWGCGLDVGIAGLVAIQVELHVFSSSRKQPFAALRPRISTRSASSGRSREQDGKWRMVMNDPIGDARAKHV